MVSPTTIGCVNLTPPSGFEALCSRIGVFLMVECVSSCADFLVLLFVVIGFIPHTSCILLLFIVVCRGRGTFVSMWVVDRCASPQILEVSFHHAFPTSMDRIRSTSC